MANTIKKHTTLISNNQTQNYNKKKHVCSPQTKTSKTQSKKSNPYSKIIITKTDHKTQNAAKQLP